MAVTVQKLYESAKSFEMELAAGEQGLHRVVRWCHMVESAEISDFLEGEEITFTTGVGLSGKEELLPIVKSIIDRGASGIVINIGPFIQEVSQELKDYCSACKVPLFLVPWHIHMAQIMRQFTQMILVEEKQQMEVSTALENALFYPKQEENYVACLENTGLEVHSTYTVILLHIRLKENEHMPVKKILLHQMESFLELMEWKALVKEVKEDIVILLGGCKEEKALLRWKELLRNCSQFQNLEEYCAGIGQEAVRLYQISKSYQQAKYALRLYDTDTGLQEEQGVREYHIKRYSELGIYKLLLTMSDREVIQNYIEETMGPLIAYDEINDSNLKEVLCLYMKHNGSVKETAEELYVHRNTVNYKIHRIGEILGKDLSAYDTLGELGVALKLYDILHTGRA